MLKNIKYISLTSFALVGVLLAASASAESSFFSKASSLVGGTPVQTVVLMNEVETVGGTYQPYVDAKVYNSKGTVCFTLNDLSYLAPASVSAGPGMGCDAITKIDLKADNSPFSPAIAVWDTSTLSVPIIAPIAAPGTELLIKADAQPVFNSDGSIKTPGTIKVSTLTKAH